VNGECHATVLEIARMHKTGHPVLLGTTSMEQSEALSKWLTETSIPHQVEGEHSFVSVIISPHKPWQLLLCLSKKIVCQYYTVPGIVCLLGLSC
jgi:hypothetical protein